jgi:glyoxylate reductase
VVERGAERPIVAVTNRLPESALQILRTIATLRASDAESKLDTGDLLQLIAGADAVLTMLHDRVDAEFFEAAGPSLRCVANVAVGYDNIDLEAAARCGVDLSNTPGVLDDATADLALALILAVSRRVAEGDRLVRAGTPWAWGMSFMLGHDLRGKRLGIVGMGNIGRGVARRARAFGMEVLYTTRRPPGEGADGEGTWLELGQLLEQVDVVSLHCPLTAETKHLIDVPQLERMKPSAILINTARGAVVREAALAEALRTGTIAAAGLDVFEHEPRVDPALLALNNVVLTPHLGSATVETRTAMAELAARNVVAALRGGPLLTPIAARPSSSSASA